MKGFASHMIKAKSSSKRRGMHLMKSIDPINNFLAEWSCSIVGSLIFAVIQKLIKSADAVLRGLLNNALI